MTTTEDGIPIIEIRRKYSISEDTEEINYPPSTELIPDEYKHESKTGLVFIFYGVWDEPNMEILKQALTDQNYDVPEENIIPLTTKDNTLSALKSILKQNYTDKTCLLMFVMGFLLEQDLILPDEEKHIENAIRIKDVWMNFTGDNCEFMRNKPKIFIFQGSKKIDSVQVDGIVKPEYMTFIPPKEAYKLPAEADMLVIYKKLEIPSGQEGFIQQFCNILDQYGNKDDIIGIISRINDKQRPLIISTLTRKFFLTSNHIRGHYLDFTANHARLLQMIKEINDKMQDIQDNKNKIKGRGNSMRMQKIVSDSPSSSNCNEVTDSKEPKTNLNLVGPKSALRSKSSSKRRVAGPRVLTRPPWRF